MNPASRRRSTAAVLTCAALLAAPPAFAAPPAAKQNHGQAGAPGQAAKQAAPAPAPAPAPPPAAAAPAPAPPAAAKAPRSRGNGGSKRSGGTPARTSPRPAPKPSAPAAAGQAPRPSAGRAATAGAPARTSAARTRTSAAPTRTSAAPARSSAAPAKRRDAKADGATAASKPATATSTAAAPGTSQSAPAADSSPSAAAADASQSAAADASQSAAASAAAAATSATLRGAALAAAERRERYYYDVSDQLLGIEASAAGVTPLPAGALGPATPGESSPVGATSARLEVREVGGVSSARPAVREQPGVKRLERRSAISNALNRVDEVVPTWLWIALGILSALVLMLGAHTVFAAARTRRLERQRAELMEDIGLLQEALLPAVPATMGGLATSVAYRPAEGLAAGGDFYDAFALPGERVGVLLGDVSGHGRESLAKTALVRFTVRAHLEAGMSPREAISIAGRSLDGRLGDDFATVIAAIHDPAQGTLTYSSAGHPPPLVIGPPAHDPLTASSAPPIDAGFPTGQRQTVLPMPEGTTVALFSDGLTEARLAGAPIGPQRLTAWLADLGPDATAKQLVDLVVDRADRVPDDLAAVILHAQAGATAPAARVEQLKLDVLDADGPDLEVFLQAAGVSRAERRLVGRRVSEELAVTGGVMVEVRAGEHPQVEVSPIGGGVRASRSRARAR